MCVLTYEMSKVCTKTANKLSTNKEAIFLQASVLNSYFIHAISLRKNVPNRKILHFSITSGVFRGTFVSKNWRFFWIFFSRNAYEIVSFFIVLFCGILPTKFSEHCTKVVQKGQLFVCFLKFWSNWPFLIQLGTFWP